MWLLKDKIGFVGTRDRIRRNEKRCWMKRDGMSQLFRYPTTAGNVETSGRKSYKSKYSLVL